MIRSRPSALGWLWLALLAFDLQALAADPTPPRSAPAATVVLVHGGWGASYAFRPIEQQLRARGHEVFRPTLFGTGETSHLASPAITLDTHITQITNLILYEDLRDVVLVGYSYSGMVISGVADRIPERLGLLIYVDAFVPQDGESAMDIANLLIDKSPSLAAFKSGVLGAQHGGMVPPFWQKPDEPPPRQDPQPSRTIFEPIRLPNGNARLVPAAFIQFVPDGAPPESADFESSAQRARQRGWPMMTIAGPHNAIFGKAPQVTEAIESLIAASKAK